MAFVLGALAAAPAQATGAETVGEAFEPTAGCGGSFTFLQTLSPVGQYEVSADGVITSWSIHASDSPVPVRLKVARHVSGNSFEIRGESSVQTPAPSVLNTFDGVRILGMTFFFGFQATPLQLSIAAQVEPDAEATGSATKPRTAVRPTHLPRTRVRRRFRPRGHRLPRPTPTRPR